MCLRVYTLAVCRVASYAASFADNRRPRTRNARRWCSPCRYLVIPVAGFQRPPPLWASHRRFQSSGCLRRIQKATLCTPPRHAFSRFSLIERSAEDLTSCNVPLFALEPTQPACSNLHYQQTCSWSLFLPILLPRKLKRYETQPGLTKISLSWVKYWTNNNRRTILWRCRALKNITLFSFSWYFGSRCDNHSYVCGENSLEMDFRDLSDENEPRHDIIRSVFNVRFWYYFFGKF